MPRKASPTKAKTGRPSVQRKPAERKRKPREWAALTPSERIARCRTFAADARKSERAASPEMKPLYRDLYIRWTTLADELQRQLKSPT